MFIANLRAFQSCARLYRAGTTVYFLRFIFNRPCGRRFDIGAVGLRPARYFRTGSGLSKEITVSVPPFPESVSEGDVRWEKKEGESVSKDEVVCEIETDKTAIPIPSPDDGVLVARLVGDNTTVKSGQQLFRLALGKGKTEAVPKPAPSPKPVPKTKPQHFEAPPPRKTADKAETRVKMTSLRQTIAKRLKDAQNTYAMLTTYNEVDMSGLIAFRKANQKAFQKKHGIKLGFMSAFLKASAFALRHQPVVNAVISGDDIVYRDYVDISVAVAGPRGLMVPVVRGVDLMNYADIEKAIAALADKVKRGTITLEEMKGGTFTVSNGGVFGSLMSSPIVNPPQSAILGMNGVFERPVVIKGQIVIRPMMYVALTYDHRLIDGREAVIFLRKIKAGVEDPKIMLLDL